MCRVHNAKAKTDPLLPRSRTSPVGGGRMIRRTEQDLNRWLAGVRNWLIGQIEGIPTEVIGNRVVTNRRYEYLISLSDLRRIVSQLHRRMEAEGPRQMLVNRATAAYRQATSEAVMELARLTDDYTRTVTQVLQSQPYTRRAALVGARVFEVMEGFQGERAGALGRELMDAVQRGVNPRDVARTIRRRFGESRSRALRIARTEITGALRRGRLDESRDAQERLGIRTGQLWFSALSPTTRDSHAERHGRVYTVDEVLEFYSEDGNAINCLCSVRDVLLDDDGNPVSEALVRRERDRERAFMEARRAEG